MDKIAEFLGIGKGKRQEVQPQIGTTTPESIQANVDAWSKVPDAKHPADKNIIAQNESQATGNLPTELNNSLDNQPLTLPQKGETGYIAPTNEATPMNEPTQIPTAPAAEQATEPIKNEPIAA